MTDFGWSPAFQTSTVLAADILHDGFRIRQSELPVHKVGQAGEGEAESVFLARPRCLVVIWCVAHRILNLFKLNAEVYQQVADVLSRTSCLPVAQLGLFFTSLGQLLHHVLFYVLNNNNFSSR